MRNRHRHGIDQDELRLIRVDHHRNGVDGESFDVIQFNDPEYGRMMGVVYPATFHVAVFNMGKIGEGDTGMGSNSWRGDQYEPWLRLVLDNNEDACTE